MKVGRIRDAAAAALLAVALITCSHSKPAPANLATPVGTAMAAAVSATIGTGGGSLAAPGGSLRLAVPAGVLPGPARVTIQPVTNQAHGGVGTAYRIEAAARVARVRLIFSYREDDVKGSAPGQLRVAFQRKDGHWQVAKGGVLDTKARTVTVETDHFSDWSLVRGRVLKPSEATVKVGKTAYFEVLTCVAPKTEKGDLEPLLIPCTPKGLPGDAEWEGATWEVNGRAGGDATIGTIAEASGGTRSGRYVAPAKVPNPDEVMVSARFKSDEDLPGGTDIVTATVRIEDDDPPPESGQVALSVTATCEAEYHFSDGTSSVTDHVTVTLKERSVYRIVQYDNGENGTDLELVSYRSRLSPSGGGQIHSPAEIPPDLLASSWTYRNREPTHPFGGLRLDLPRGQARVGLWANPAEMLQATPEQAWAGAGGVAVGTINDAERDGTTFREAMRASFKGNEKRVEVTGHATHSYTPPGGHGSGRLRVDYSITGGVSAGR